MAIAFVNAIAEFNAGSSTTIAGTATSLTAGNCIVVCARTESFVSTITDTAGNTYRQIGVETASITRIEMWIAEDVTGNGSNVVTVTFAAASSNRAIATAQFSGVALERALDSMSTGQGGATLDAKSFSSTVANAVIVMYSQINTTGTDWGEGSGFTLAAEDASTVTHLQYDIVSSLQTGITPEVTNANSTAKCCIAAILTEPLSGGSPSPDDSGGSSRSRVQRRM